jgi:hypothetical protein
MYKYLWVIAATFTCSQLPAMADVITPGTNVEVRPDARIDVARWDRGRIYPAEVARNVYSRNGDLTIPQGSPAELIVRRIGPAQYELDLESVTINGQRYVMDTTGPQYNMSQSYYNNGNGIVGAIAGAIAGANGEQVEPQGAEIRVPPGSVITFQLREPLHVVSWADPGYEGGPYHYHHDHDWYR